MPPQHPGGWPSDDDGFEEYECIDLTSSPEPPSRPQPQPRRLPDMASSSSRPRPAPTVPPSLHPGQLRQIVYDSDATSLRNVLLNLCKLSPALSGAVARGLAPSSPYAQASIKAYRNKLAAPNIKSDPGTTPKHIVPNANKIHASTPQPPRVKHEPNTVAISDDDDDDDEGLFEVDIDDLFTPRSETKPSSSLAGPSSSRGLGERSVVKSEWPSSSQLPVRQSAQTPARNGPHSAKIKTEPAPRGRKCKHCSERFVDQKGVCVYHPGRKVVVPDDQGGRISVYKCCRGRVNEPGCLTGTHVPQPEEDFNQWLVRSPTAQNREPKRPRLE